MNITLQDPQSLPHVRVHRRRGLRQPLLTLGLLVPLIAALPPCAAAAGAEAPVPVRVTTPVQAQATLPGHDPAGTLTLAQAIRLAQDQNLRFQAGFEQVEQARNALAEALGANGLQVGLTASQAQLTNNLVAQGFPQSPATRGLFPVLNGPFRSFDARLRAAITLFDPVHVHLAERARAELGGAEAQRQAEREQLATAVTLAYIQAQQGDAALQAAEANLALARELAVQARDQRTAGLATGVDVARAETREAQEQLAVSQARNQRAQALVQLKRVVGLGAGDPVQLATALAYVPVNLPGLDEAVTQAWNQRSELRMMAAREQAAEQGVQAAQSERLPVVTLQGDIGPSGATPREYVYATHSVAIGISVPLYTSGQLDARRDQARSAQTAARLLAGDMRRQVEEDVHLAWLSLQTAGEQVGVAERSLALAERLLELARDRFKSGVADNLEVLDALTQATSARSRLIDATAAYSGARTNLAAAMGDERALGL